MLNYRKSPRAQVANRPVFQTRQSIDIRILTCKGGDHRTRACGRNLVTGRITLAARRTARPGAMSFSRYWSRGCYQGATNEVGEPIKGRYRGHGGKSSGYGFTGLQKHVARMASSHRRLKKYTSLHRELNAPYGYRVYYR